MFTLRKPWKGGVTNFGWKPPLHNSRNFISQRSTSHAIQSFITPGEPQFPQLFCPCIGRDYLPEASPGTEVRVDTLPLRHSAIMTSSNGTIFRVTGPLCWEFTGHRWIPRTKASDAELWCFLWYVWINGRVNNREAGDLRRHRAHYVVTVMPSSNNTNIDTDREMCKIQRYGYIKNSAWVTVNNDFLGHEWGDLPIIFTSDEVTSENHWQIASRVTQKSLVTVTNAFFFFSYTLFDVLNTQFRWNNYRSLISPLSLRTVFFDLVLWRHHIWSVTSRECRTLALWRHIRQLFLHVQIGAKANFSSE